MNIFCLCLNTLSDFKTISAFITELYMWLQAVLRILASAYEHRKCSELAGNEAQYQRVPPVIGLTKVLLETSSSSTVVFLVKHGHRLLIHSTMSCYQRNSLFGYYTLEVDTERIWQSITFVFFF